METNGIGRLVNLPKSSIMSTTAYEKIRDAIIFSEIAPGEFLSENSIAKALNMSRTPVREAIKKLSNEGLVTLVVGRGGYVSSLSRKDLSDVYGLRGVLECMALETSLKNISNVELNEMEKSWLLLSELLGKGEEVDWNKMSRYDNRLHSLIVERSENSRLIYFMKILNLQILRYQYLAAKVLGDASETIRQHLEIIDFIRANELTGARYNLQEHIRSSEEVIQKANVFK